MIERHGQPVAALVHVRILEAIEEKINEADLEEAKKALEKAQATTSE